MKREREDAVEVKDWDNNAIRARYPNQWVAIEVLEVTDKVGITKGRLIARGRRSNEQKVLAKLNEFRDANPNTQFALFYTGNFIRRGQDVIMVA